VVLLHVQLHCHQVALSIGLSTPRDKLACHTDGAVAEVVGAALHLLGVSVEVMASDSDADEEVAVLHVVDVHVPGVLAAGDAQGAQHSGVVTALIGHLGDSQAIDDMQVTASTHFIPPAPHKKLPAMRTER
jgi:hypothetical protein